jgi:hypothetical protein
VLIESDEHTFQPKYYFYVNLVGGEKNYQQMLELVGKCPVNMSTGDIGL